jgi:uncharacterized membrane protein YkoI
MFKTHRRTIAVIAAASATVAGAVIYLVMPTGASQGGQLDDGKDLLPKASITLDEAIAAAQATGPGAIDEVDLEYAGDTLVFNVDVGDRDVQVDAATGKVVSSSSDD